jgi:hypothetical protein
VLPSSFLVLLSCFSAAISAIPPTTPSCRCAPSFSLSHLQNPSKFRILLSPNIFNNKFGAHTTGGFGHMPVRVSPYSKPLLYTCRHRFIRVCSICRLVYFGQVGLLPDSQSILGSSVVLREVRYMLSLLCSKVIHYGHKVFCANIARYCKVLHLGGLMCIYLRGDRVK